MSRRKSQIVLPDGYFITVADMKAARQVALEHALKTNGTVGYHFVAPWPVVKSGLQEIYGWSDDKCEELRKRLSVPSKIADSST